MKVLKIIGIVAGIHVFAILIIFMNPGCSKTRGASLSDSTAPADDASSPVSPVAAPGAPSAPASGPVGPAESAPGSTQGAAPGSAGPSGASPITYVPESGDNTTIRFSPTRPGTAAAEALEASPVADVTPATTYTVVKGDSLSLIAKHFHIGRADLASANHLRTGAPLHIGQKLLIPTGKGRSTGGAAAAGSAAAGSREGKASPAGAEAGSPAGSRSGGESTRYEVKPGESLGIIARRFGVRVSDIEVANAITDPKKVRAGQVLQIPARGHGGKASATPRAKPARETQEGGAGGPGATEPAPAAAPAPSPAPSISPISIEPLPNSAPVQPAQEADSASKSPAGPDVPVVKVEDDPKP